MKRITLIIAVLLQVPVFCAYGITTSQEQTFTIKQSWSLVLRGPRLGGGYLPFDKINKNIHSKLLKLLKNDSFNIYKSRMVIALGYISEKGDAKYVEQQLKLLPRGVTKKYPVDPALYIKALCNMSAHGNNEAALILNKMFEEKYWTTINFKWYAPHVKHALSFEYQSICRLWTLYALSGHKDFETRAKLIVDKYPRKTDKSFTYLKAYLNINAMKKELQHRKSVNIKTVGEKTVIDADYLKDLDDYYEKYVKPLFDGKDLEKSTRQTVILDKKRSRALMKIPNDKLLQDLYAPQATSPQNDTLIKTIEKQANNFLDHIRNSLHTQKYTQIENQILDNGKVVPSYKYKDNKEALSKELDIQREIFDALEKASYEKKGLQIRRNELFVKVKNNYEIEWRKVEEITVTFELKDDENLYRKFFKRMSPSAMRTMSDNKNFQIYFKRINGKWFWNPFGW